MFATAAALMLAVLFAVNHQPQRQRTHAGAVRGLAPALADATSPANATSPKTRTDAGRVECGQDTLPASSLTSRSNNNVPSARLAT